MTPASTSVPEKLLALPAWSFRSHRIGARDFLEADHVSRGEVLLNGKTVERAPADSVRLGVGLVPENRKTEGLALIRSVHDNLLVAGLRVFSQIGGIRLAGQTQLVTRLIARLSIARPSARRLTRFLSGGNQQKVVIAEVA